MFLKCQPFTMLLNYVSIEISLAHVEKRFQTILPRKEKYNADVSDNICVAAHFVPRLDPVARSLSETPIPTRAKRQIRTKSEQTFRAHSLSEGWHTACGRIATARYLLARCYRGLWRASSTPERLYGWKLNGLRESSTTARNSSLVNSKVSRISRLSLFFSRPKKNARRPLHPSHLYEQTRELGSISQKPDVRQLSGKWIIRFALTVARLEAFLVIVGKSF